MYIRKYVDSISGIWRRPVRQRNMLFPTGQHFYPKIHREKPVNQGNLHYSTNGTLKSLLDNR